MIIALEKKDDEELRRIGHGLKGAAMMYQFIYLGKLGKIIEDAAEKKDLNTIEKTLEKLKYYLPNIQFVYK